jgi:hypothetical protein
VGNIDSTETRKVLERRIDTVLEADTKDGPFLIAIEAQNKPSNLKQRNWAYYPAYLHELKGCPVVVIVVCRDPITAKWAREPYRIGLRDRPTLVSTPIVIGPDNLPRITDVELVIADPYFAALCALAHARDPAIGGILEALAAALAKLDEDLSRNLYELIERGLEDTPAQEDWRLLMALAPMNLQPRSRWAQEHVAKGREEGLTQGRAEGLAESVLLILDHRAIEMSSRDRAYIAACVDIDVLKTWLDEALSIAGIDQLTGFDEA